MRDKNRQIQDNREDGFFFSPFFNPLHDLNFSICNEYYDELILFYKVFPTLTTF